MICQEKPSLKRWKFTWVIKNLTDAENLNSDYLFPIDAKLATHW